jgi:hypothetical protein
MNVLTILAETLASFQNWGVYSVSPRDITKYIRDMREAKSHKHQENIRKAMLFRVEISHL